MDRISPRIRADEHWPDLAEKLTTAHCNGIDVPAALTAAAAQGPLPDDLPAAALWWRLSARLTPAAKLDDPARPGGSTVHETAHGRHRWTELAAEIHPRLGAGPDWPQLAAAITRAHDAGYNVAINLPRLAAQQPLPRDRPAAELYWRLLEDCEAAEPPLTRAAVQASAYVPHHIRHPHEPPPYLRAGHSRDTHGPAH